MNIHSLNRFLDFTSDPRMLHNFIPAISRRRRVASLLRNARHLNGRELLVAFTCDVELAYGSHRVNRNNPNMSTLLRSILDSSIIDTVFVEGHLVEENAGDLCLLRKRGVEIGLHGYRHELWGRSQWYLPDRPTAQEQRKVLLEAGMQAFLDAGLLRPVIFRAPNLVVDTSTLGLLVKNGFCVDSSLPSHRGVLPIPQFFDEAESLVRIPVTSDPIPLLTRKGALPYYRYTVFNLKTLAEMRRERLLKHLSRIVALQEALGFSPHIVILSHSWEFSNPVAENGNYGYCSPRNFEVIQFLDSTFSEAFSVKHATISALAELLKRTNSNQQQSCAG